MSEAANHDPAAVREMPDFAAVDVRTASDRMSASLYIIPLEGASGELTLDHLRAALDRAEVARGIDIAALRAVAEDWNKNPRELETPVIARGADAAPEKMGALRLSVKHLTAPADIALAQKSSCYWEIMQLEARFQRVDPGTIVARRAVGAPSLLGYDIFGTALNPAVEGTGMPELDAIREQCNVYYAGNTYTASATGVVYTDDMGLPRVIPIDFNCIAEVKTAPDMMSAELTLTPAGERGSVPSIGSVRDILGRAGVTFGIDDNTLHQTLSRFQKGNATAPETIAIAQGLPSVKGEDGYIDFCFNTESSPAPMLNPDGTADYRNINIVTSVGAGSILARRHPPTEGTPGMDITGRKIAALSGTPAMLPIGSNTMVPTENPDTLVSTTDGIVRFDGSAVNVSEGYAIPGDVDYSTGNINYEHSVAINGDIKSGFEVKCGGDLQVNGIIEDCDVTVKGNVLCRYGFVGNGKGTIKSGGDVNLVYIKNQTVVSRGNVNIAKESINSNITARKSIKIHGHNLSVAGGVLAANESITVKTVGNISGVKTTLAIEPEPELVAQMAIFKTSVEQHETNVAKLTQSIETLPPAKRADKEFVRKLKNAIIAIKQEIQAVEEKMRALNIVMNRFENSFIRIERCAYPGTIFQIGQRQLVLTEILNAGKTLRMIDQEIKVL